MSKTEQDESTPTPIRHSWGYRFAKRMLDVLAAVFGLALTWPILVVFAIWVKLDSPGPVFYRGRRTGRGGRSFGIFKYRSMVVNADKIGGPTTSENDPRVTKSGRFIRKYKIDELPQLINILVGDMSLVGPRPDVPSEIEKLSLDEKGLILAVRPGMTDWASIRFNNEGEIVQGHPDPHKAYEDLIRPHKLRLQMEYVRRASMGTDIKILWNTFRMLWSTRVTDRSGTPAPGGPL